MLTEAYLRVAAVVMLAVLGDADAVSSDTTKCYSCKGFSGDAMCGTPFNDLGLTTCRGASCVVNRVWKAIKDAKKPDQKSAKYVPCAVWTPYDNAGALGGKPSSVTSLNACLTACFYGDRCAAAEWNAKNPLGRNCVLHSTPLPPERLLSSTETTRFQLDKPPNCPPCGSQWIAIVGMYYSMSGAQNVSNLDDCLSMCVKMPECIGVDWNSTAVKNALASGSGVRGQQCSLLQAAVYTTRYTIDDDMEHYEIIRNGECKGGYEKITRDCSRSFARMEPTCRPLRGVKNGISCTCSSDLCNGDDYDMMTQEYSQLMDVGALADVFDDSRSSAATGGEAGSWRHSAVAFKASKRRKPHGLRIMGSSERRLRRRARGKFENSRRHPRRSSTFSQK